MCLGALAAPAAAQGSDDPWTVCSDRGTLFWAGGHLRAIDNCTKVLAEQELSRERRETALLRRAAAYTLWSGFNVEEDKQMRLVPRSEAAMKGDVMRAVADLSEALELNPENFSAMEDRGNLYIRLKDFANALKDLNAVIKHDPTAAYARRSRADIYFARGDNVSAFADLDETVRLKPTWGNYNIRGKARLNHHDYVRALTDYRESWRLLLAEKPQDTTSRNSVAVNQAMLCWEFAEAGQLLDTANELCDAALSFENLYDRGNAWDSKGLIALRQNRFQDAWNNYDQAVKLDAKHASFFYGRGIAAQRLGRAAESQSDIAQALTLDPKIAGTYAGYGIK